MLTMTTLIDHYVEPLAAARALAPDLNARAAESAALRTMPPAPMLHAPYDSVVAEIFVSPGAHVDSKDLLVELRASNS